MFGTEIVDSAWNDEVGSVDVLVGETVGDSVQYGLDTPQKEP